MPIGLGFSMSFILAFLFWVRSSEPLFNQQGPFFPRSPPAILLYLENYLFSFSWGFWSVHG